MGALTERCVASLSCAVRAAVLPLASVASAMVSSAPSEAPQMLFIDLNMSWDCGTRALSSAAAAEN